MDQSIEVAPVITNGKSSVSKDLVVIKSNKHMAEKDLERSCEKNIDIQPSGKDLKVKSSDRCSKRSSSLVKNELCDDDDGVSNERAHKSRKTDDQTISHKKESVEKEEDLQSKDIDPKLESKEKPNETNKDTKQASSRRDVTGKSSKKTKKYAKSDSSSRSDSSDKDSKTDSSDKEDSSGTESSDDSASTDNDSRRRKQRPPDKRKHSPSPKKGNEKHSSTSEAKSAPVKQRLKIKRDNIVVSRSKDIQTKSDSKIKIEVQSSRSSTEDSRSMEFSKERTDKKKDESAPIPKYTSRKISLSSHKKSDTDEPKSKRGKWGCLSSQQKASQSISISSDSLKNWFPDLKLVTTSSTEEEPIPVTQTVAVPMEGDEITMIVKEPENDKKENKENIVLEEDLGEASKILLLENLVRPFTLNQLMDLLRQTGRIIEDSFWIDKIKSKCVVTYETEDEALQTRLALHNTRWPPSNPKILNVRYSSEEELEMLRQGIDVQKASNPENKATFAAESQEVIDRKDDNSEEIPRKKDRKHRDPPMREWDRDKIVQESPERLQHHKKEDRKGSKKHEEEDDTPAKLLDDLFQKTKSTPCIYWLPLTEEQIVNRDTARAQRRAERERIRREQSSKTQRRSASRSRSPVAHRR